MDIYEDPNPLLKYKCSSSNKSTGFSLLMKWVMLTRKNPEMHEAIKEYIKDNSTELNKQNTMGWTALMLASRNSNTDSTENTVSILLEAGADVNISNYKNFTALMVASRNSNTDSTENTVKMLIDAKSNVDAQTTRGYTALMFASVFSNTRSTKNTVKMLIDAKSNVNIKNKYCNTVLLSLMLKNIREDNTENIIKMLLEANADVNIRDANGNSALIQVIQSSLKDSENIIKMLLDAGANVNCENKYNVTALTIAINSNYENIINLLINAGAEISIKQIRNISLYNEKTKEITSNIMETQYAKTIIKKLFSKNVIKHIPYHVNIFKLKYGTLSQKIITYNLQLQVNDKDIIYKKICDLDKQLLIFLNINSPNDLYKLSEYVNCL